MPKVSDRTWLLLLLFACGPAAPTVSVPTTSLPPSTVQSSATAFVASIERRPSFCIGTECTAYKATVYESGEVIWEGISGVRVKGQAHAKVTGAELDRLRDAFRQAGFTSYLPSYDCSEKTDASIFVCGSDAPTCRLTFSDGGRIKTVVHDLGDGLAPRTLTSLEERVDEILGTARWVR